MATQNPYEKNRRKLQGKLDPLKERIEQRLDGDESKGLSPKEGLRLDTLKEALRRLSAAEAEDHKSALILAEEITWIGRTGTMDELLAIKVRGDEEAPIVSNFFVNERADLLVNKGEIDRLDYRYENKRSIFLAGWKYWLGMDTKTTHACLLVLSLSVAFCLSITTMILLQRKHRVT